MKIEDSHRLSEKVLTKNTDSNAHNSAVHNFMDKNWAQPVSQSWELQKCSDRKLSSCARRSVQKVLLGNNHDRVLI